MVHAFDRPPRPKVIPKRRSMQINVAEYLEHGIIYSYSGNIYGTLDVELLPRDLRHPRHPTMASSVTGQVCQVCVDGGST